MKAITLWQPYASLVAVGLKPIETRTHNRFRSLAGSRIAIHAAKREPPSRERREIWHVMHALGVASDGDVIFQWLARLPLGKILCTAHVAKFGMLNEKDHAVGACCHIDKNRFGLFLDDVRRLETHIPYKGHQGIYHVPDNLLPETAR